MDAIVSSLFSMIRAARAFEERGCSDPTPLSPSAKGAAGRAASVLTHLLASHANRAEPLTLTLRGLRDHVREMDAMVCRMGGAVPPEAVLALWAYRRELAGRMGVHPGGVEVAETLDMLPEGARARVVADQAAALPIPPRPDATVPARALRETPEGQPETVPVPNGPPPREEPDHAPIPEQPKAPEKTPEPAEAAARLVGDNFQFGARPTLPAAAAAEAEPLELTRGMLVAPPPAIVSRNAPGEDEQQARDKREAHILNVGPVAAALGGRHAARAAMKIGDAIESMASKGTVDRSKGAAA